MILLETDRLRIRNWVDTDSPLFFEINDDPQVMAFFPRRRTRAECDGLIEKVRRRIASTGLGSFALALRDNDEPIGMLGLAPTDLEPFLPNGTVEIGWRLAVRFWGKGYVTEAAKALLTHGFQRHGLSEIVSFAVERNSRSTSVMERIGMHREATRDFDHPRVPDTHAHLRRHLLYAINAPQT